MRQLKTAIYQAGNKILANLHTTYRCPKIKLTLGKYLELAVYGFQMGIFNSKEDLLGHNPSGPWLGYPKMYSTS